MAIRYRQEVLNVLLAQLLQERGTVSTPESIVKGPLSGSRKMPDVIVNYNGLRTAIEGEVADGPHACERALASAHSRVEDAIAHIGVAVVYPATLRSPDFAELKAELARCELGLAIVTESDMTGFVTGNVDYLEQALRNAFNALVKEDVVAKAVAALDEGIEHFALAVATKPGIVGRMAEALGIRELPSKSVEG
jgi:hypothetical protein